MIPGVVSVMIHGVVSVMIPGVVSAMIPGVVSAMRRADVELREENVVSFTSGLKLIRRVEP